MFPNSVDIKSVASSVAIDGSNPPDQPSVVRGFNFDQFCGKKNGCSSNGNRALIKDMFFNPRQAQSPRRATPGPGEVIVIGVGVGAGCWL